MAVLLVWAVACWAFFQFAYKYHFFYQEQNQIFLLSADWLSTYFSKPAWLSCMAGDFITQFYYYLFAGPALLTLVLLTTGDLCRRALEKAGLQAWAAFVPAVAVMTLLAVLCFSETYRLSSVISAGGAMLLFLLTYTGTKGKGVPAALAALIGTAATFWMFGYAVFIYALLTAMTAVIRHRRYAAATCTAAIVPLLLIPLTRNFYLLDISDLYAYPGIGKIGAPSFDLERLFEVDNLYYWQRDNKVIETVEHTPRSKMTLEMTFYYNLASARQGRLADNLLKIQPTDLGVFERIGPQTPMTKILRMNELYFLLGDMTFAERAAMMKNVFSPGNRNVRMMKRLAETSLITGDNRTAEKYLRILSKTIAYRRWAAERMPGRQTTAVREWLRNKRMYINRTDTIRLTDNAHYIMNELVESNPRNDAAVNYMLCSDLILRDMKTFWDDYNTFCMNTHCPRTERIYQEALLICLAATHTPLSLWRQYVSDRSLAERFAIYSTQRGSAAYKDTYWYYYDTHDK